MSTSDPEVVGALSAQVLRLCDEYLARPDATGTAQVREARSGLTDVLRVAVAGRVNAGKSTVVNALLGKRVAPTDETECTQVVTWFRFGQPERVELCFRDGSPSRDIQLDPDGMLPRRLDVDVDVRTVRRLTVWLSLDTLRRITLIDTPGLASLTGAYSQASADLLGQDSQQAAVGAHALAFLINHAVRADDVEALETFRKVAAGTASSSINAIAVLNKADILTGVDPWKTAVELTERHAQTLRGQVAAVIPLIGLVAESAAAGQITEADVDHLRALSALGRDVREDLLYSVDEFQDYPCAVPIEARARLVRLLGLYGLRRCFELIDSGAGGATRLRPALEQLANLPALTEALVGSFARRGDALKAAHALGALERLGYGAAHTPELEQLRAAAAELRDSPAMHPLRELAAEQALDSGEVSLPEELLADFRRVSATTDVGERLGLPGADRAQLADAARAGVSRWKVFAHSEASPRQRFVAEVMERSYLVMFLDVSS